MAAGSIPWLPLPPLDEPMCPSLIHGATYWLRAHHVSAAPAPRDRAPKQNSGKPYSQEEYPLPGKRKELKSEGKSGKCKLHPRQVQWERNAMNNCNW